MRSVLPLIAVVFLALLSCKQEGDKSSETVELIETQSAQVHPGKALMENKCALCHSASASQHEGRIAPPMIAVKAHYLKSNTTKTEFTEALWNFVEEPTEEKSRMRGAVRRFGLMPAQTFKKEEIELIAEYLYEYQIEEPTWFKEHWESNPKRKPYRNQGKKAIEQEQGSWEELGLKYALQTKKVLGKNLMGALQNQGTQEALQFCNERAYPLTDSMALHFGVKIKRLSDKARNPENQASPEELEVITHFKEAVAEGQEVTPYLRRGKGRNTVYYPIITNSMCLQCHGRPQSDIKPAVLASIRELYPTDKAIGYSIDQVRGIWSIEMEEK